MQIHVYLKKYVPIPSRPKTKRYHPMLAPVVFKTFWVSLDGLGKSFVTTTPRCDKHSLDRKGLAALSTSPRAQAGFDRAPM